MAYSNKHQHSGFTVVELMIAITVFSVLMLIVTIGVFQVAREYQQASTRTRLESASRNIHQQVADGVKYSGSTPALSTVVSGWQSLCTGNQRFTFASSLPTYTSSSYTALNTGLYLYTDASGPCSASSPGPTVGTNLLPTNARVVSFVYDSLNGAFVTKFIVSDSDLVDFGATGAAGELKCKAPVVGGEYCAVVELQSSFIKRVN